MTVLNSKSVVQLLFILSTHKMKHTNALDIRGMLPHKYMQ